MKKIFLEYTYVRKKANIRLSIPSHETTESEIKQPLRHHIYQKMLSYNVTR